MSLRLSGVDPYLKEAMTWIASVVRSWGGSEVIFSGRRTRADQQRLWDDCFARRERVSKLPRVPCPYPVATPGCSQHEYGFAVDAGFIGRSTGLMMTPDWTPFAQDLGRVYWGLSTVQNDPFHFAMYPTSTFLPWVKATGQCVQAPKLSFLPDPLPLDSQTVVNCGITATGSICNHLSGCQCFY